MTEAETSRTADQPSERRFRTLFISDVHLGSKPRARIISWISCPITMPKRSSSSAISSMAGAEAQLVLAAELQ